MSKFQKVFLWLGLCLFLIPEILWSPILNELYLPFSKCVNGLCSELRKNILFNKNNDHLWSNLILVQLTGSLFLVIFWYLNSKKVKNRFIYWLIFLILIVVSIIIYLTFESVTSFSTAPIF